MLLFIILITILLITILLIYITTNKIENFQWDPLDVGKNAVDCYSQTEGNCLKFSNCGICYKNGITKCIPGDQSGSFFEEGCDLWKYTNYYDGHIFDQTKTTITNSWDHFKHGYEVMYPGPADIFTL